MRYDRTEMLYWLQQERRAAVLQPATVTLASPALAVITVPSGQPQTLK